MAILSLHMNEHSLLRLATAYADHAGHTLSTVSTRIAGSGDLFTRLGNGSTITIRRANQLAKRFSDVWPEDLSWPEGVERPPRGSDNLPS